MNFFRKIYIYLELVNLYFLLVIFTISSLVEVVGIGLLGTYVSYLINPENFLIGKISKFLEFFNYI